MIILKILAVVIFGIPVVILCLLAAFSSVFYVSGSTVYEIFKFSLAKSPA